MENSTALIVAEKLDPVKIFTDGGLDAVLREIEKKVAEFEPDLSTAATRKEIASMAHKVSRSKVLIDDLGKSLAADWKKKVKTVDTVRKESRDFCDRLRDRVREPLSKWEAEEVRKDEARVAAIKERIVELPVSYLNLKGVGTAEQIKAVIVELEGIKVEPDEFFEFTSEASLVLTNTLSAAKQALETREYLDKEDAERKAEDERLAAERKKQKEAEANLREAAAKIRAEQEEKDAAIQAERDKIDAENRKIAEEKAELERSKKDDRERRDREEFERKAKIQAEIDAKEEAERIQHNRMEQAKIEADEQERQEALKPDKEKLVAFGQFLQEGITYPELNSNDAKAIMRQAIKDIYDVGEMILLDAKNL